MKIAAGSVFFNSEDILPLSIENLVSHGVVDFYLFDHKSTENVVSNILDKLGNRASFHIVKKVSEPFLQGRMMSLLALSALEDGFDLFIPFDADEFLDLDSYESNLIKVLEKEFEHNSPAILVPERDYIQNSMVEVFSETNLQHIKFATKVEEVSEDLLKDFVLKGGTSLARSKSHKSIINLKKVQENPNFAIAEGSHFIGGIKRKELSVAEDLIIRHIPFRSKSALQLKAVDGERRDKAGFKKDVGFHSRKLAYRSQDFLNDYWLLNSYTEVGLDGQVEFESELVSLVADSSFSHVYERILKSRQVAETVITQKYVAATEAENKLHNLQILALAIDSPIGFPEFESLKAENEHLRDIRKHLEAEIVGVREEHDKLAIVLNNILRSTSWKITKFLRLSKKYLFR
jgi:hypothetical protein